MPCGVLQNGRYRGGIQEEDHGIGQAKEGTKLMEFILLAVTSLLVGAGLALYLRTSRSQITVSFVSPRFCLPICLDTDWSCARRRQRDYGAYGLVVSRERNPSAD